MFCEQLIRQFKKSFEIIQGQQLWHCQCDDTCRLTYCMNWRSVHEIVSDIEISSDYVIWHLHARIYHHRFGHKMHRWLRRMQQVGGICPDKGEWHHFLFYNSHFFLQLAIMRAPLQIVPKTPFSVTIFFFITLKYPRNQCK